MDFDILSAISSVGFPIAVALWFMIVGHKDSQNNTAALNKMAQSVDNNTEAIDRLKHQ